MFQYISSDEDDDLFNNVGEDSSESPAGEDPLQDKWEAEDFDDCFETEEDSEDIDQESEEDNDDEIDIDEE